MLPEIEWGLTTALLRSLAEESIAEGCFRGKGRLAGEGDQMSSCRLHANGLKSDWGG